MPSSIISGETSLEHTETIERGPLALPDNLCDLFDRVCVELIRSRRQVLPMEGRCMRPNRGDIRHRINTGEFSSIRQGMRNMSLGFEVEDLIQPPASDQASDYVRMMINYYIDWSLESPEQCIADR